MSRMSPIKIATSLLLALSTVTQAQRTKPVTQAEIDKITREAILIDTHDDVPSRTVDGYDIATPNKTGQTDLSRMKGFLGAEFFSVYVDGLRCTTRIAITDQKK